MGHSFLKLLEHGPVTWTLLEDDHDVQVFVGHDPTAPPRVINYISSTQVHATIDEVARLFQTETPHEYATYRRNFAKDIIDGALLYTLAQSSEANPRHFLGVRWMVVGSPVPAVIKHRDFCSIEVGCSMKERTTITISCLVVDCMNEGP
ncbi:hypothetical protein DYB25_007782 [Aphanomyces astaci]|uniref:START domain-containing protein n=1 Tax=Aphanomyces astaci TaxID=112090 RepID=A0A397CR37_APHAT|nr:hypothetical protein DYB25_007782 [Aphanomyces astaci]RHY36951.1 hypothetical protein DYB34_005917 [Aphanomyces astaci]RHY48345.1 hypothetical protein DYB38_007222 [Aphanomyces astaci]RHY64902.1 hypothetical protein DYB30_006118 [Aphanomyces astaci]RHY93605.1 hypothetical protein DYB31_005106 [Aphanomyces astaci]